MIKVMFFAHLREQIGTGEIEINSFKGTVKELKEYLQINHSLNNLDSIMTAVNEEFCHDETMVDEGDIIALIPPVGIVKSSMKTK
ncbi:molybdopterin converting factor subunit 1 [Bacillus sporothermodurans]|uniref:molybdopterin converting factor subunit 1 n=1 Tax=Heyndrickxia sporothermodurans TaxID=46224 RepID=UPI00192BDA73|nr:molybdopterin converting factor subunit 1 [Heyndrickxia sporothermodurans]MBL5844591.1 molybdopterin converting factor subunit 1 [Heyndrickxia sporothermodurans]